MRLNLHEPGGGYVCPTDPGEPGLLMPRVSISDNEAKLLSQMVADKAVLEIGTGLGVATRAMAQTAIQVYTLDIDSWVHENIWPELMGEYDNVAFMATRSVIPVDVVFIDGWHVRDQVVKDLDYAFKCIGDSGEIILHDAKVSQIWNAIKGFEPRFMNTKYGMAVISV